MDEFKNSSILGHEDFSNLFNCRFSCKNFLISSRYARFLDKYTYTAGLRTSLEGRVILIQWRLNYSEE